MKVKMALKSNISVPRAMAKVRDKDFQMSAAVEWYRLYSPWVPMHTGELMETVIIRPFEIEHTVPYAKRMYTGDYDFRTDPHAKASAHWNKAAEPSQKPKLIKSMQSYVDKGGLKLGK